MADSSSSNPREGYPYPLHTFVPSFVTVKLNGKGMYGVWKTQMLCLLKSHDMLGFINGTFERPAQNSVLGKEKVSDYILWERSDALVKGWILGSLSEETLGYIINLVKTNEDYTAKDVWDKLKAIYGPPARLFQKQSTLDAAELNEEEKQQKKKEAKEKKKEEDEIAKVHQNLYEATLRQNWEEVDRILRNGNVKITDKITINGNTALHVALGTTKKNEFPEKLLTSAAEDNPQLDMKNSEGSTLLHVAAIVGNIEAAKILVDKNPELLFAKDNDGDTPLNKALSNMKTDMFLCLSKLTNTRDIEMGSLFSDPSDFEDLLVNVITSEDFGSALSLSKDYTTFHSDAVLMAIAQNFPPKRNIWEKIAHKGVKKSVLVVYLISATATYVGSIVYSIYKDKDKKNDTYRLIRRLAKYTFGVGFLIMCAIVLCWIVRRVFSSNPIKMISHKIALPFKVFEKRDDKHLNATLLLKSMCTLIKNYVDSRSQCNYYNDAVLEATRQNAYEVVQTIVDHFPDAIWSTNEECHNIIQYAVINRSEKVYNLLYQMSEHKNVYKTIKDPLGNNLLHLAARLAPINKLNLISCAALQLQRELQWYKEVEGFVGPLNHTQKNSFEETPGMIFTREHKDLVIKGEKWMKATAESYTITAALITTVVFAAAITVPGGNDQNKGIPIFTNRTAFTIFAISDAISLFTSTMSLFVFLSILTANFSEQDFLSKLPRKLIIGLTTLFISTTTMLVAFDATLFLVFGHERQWVIFPIVAFTSLPFTSFVTLQFSIIADLMSSTYGCSIFGKKSDQSFY